MSRDQNAGRSHNMKTDSRSLQRVEEFRYLRTTLTNQNSPFAVMSAQDGDLLYAPFALFPASLEKHGTYGPCHYNHRMSSVDLHETPAPCFRPPWYGTGCVWLEWSSRYKCHSPPSSDMGKTTSLLARTSLPHNRTTQILSPHPALLEGDLQFLLSSFPT